MILIDTDHVTLFKYPENERTRRLIARLSALPGTELIGVSIVTVEERMRGWLAAIAKERTTTRQVFGYRALGELFEFYHQFEIIPFDEPTARQFDDLRSQRVRLGTRDLKIAATALVRSALLVSANLSDFTKVPGLRVENWMD